MFTISDTGWSQVELFIHPCLSPGLDGGLLDPQGSLAGWGVSFSEGGDDEKPDHHGTEL